MYKNVQKVVLLKKKRYLKKTSCELLIINTTSEKDSSVRTVFLLVWSFSFNMSVPKADQSMPFGWANPAQTLIGTYPPCIEIQPGRLTWNLRIHPWKKKKTSSNSPFSGSMSIFRGVVFWARFRCFSRNCRFQAPKTYLSVLVSSPMFRNLSGSLLKHSQ